jgi:thioesterase domain-containing protein
VEQQAGVLREGNWSLQWPSVVPLQRRGNRPPIFFVPGAGSDVTSLTGFARALGIEQPFYGMQPPGLDGRRRPARSVEELAAYFVTELRRAHPRGPYFLGGASYGGLVAFEMAQQLTRLGEQVAFVGLLDTHAAQFPRMLWRVPIRFRIFRRFGNTLPQPPERSFEDMAREIVGIWHARFSNRMDKLFRRPLTREGGYFDFFELALRARRRYRISPYPGKVTLFRYREQPSPALYHSDPLMGWGPAAQALDIVDVPGTHTNLSVDDAREVCNQLRARLHAAQDALGCTDASAA